MEPFDCQCGSMNCRGRVTGTVGNTLELKSLIEMISIIPYSPQFHSSYKSLNLQWLMSYNLLEPFDEMQLDDPEKTYWIRVVLYSLAQAG